MTLAIRVTLAALVVAAVICLFFAWRAPAYAGERCGTASWYGAESGGIMANGRRFNPNALTAAMWGIPLGTVLIVQNVQNGRTIRVRITDRGPARRLHRLIDLSRRAARELGIAGLGRVCVEPIEFAH